MSVHVHQIKQINKCKLFHKFRCRNSQFHICDNRVQSEVFRNSDFLFKNSKQLLPGSFAEMV